MANILDWNEVSRTELASCYKEKNIKYFYENFISDF